MRVLTLVLAIVHKQKIQEARSGEFELLSVFDKFFFALSSDQQVSKKSARLLALLFLLISFFISLFTWSEARTFWFDKNVSYAPTLATSILSLMLILPLYARGLLLWSHRNVFSVLSFILTLAFVASLTAIFLGGDNKNEVLFFDFPNLAYIVLFATILMSWLGMRAIAGMAAALFFVLAAWNAAAADIMGIWGFVFLACGVLGMVMQNDMSPQQFMISVKQDWQGHTDRISSDIRMAGQLLGGKDKGANLEKEETKLVGP